MSAINEKQALVDHWHDRLAEIVQMRANLPREELEYLVSRVEKIRDARLQSAIYNLIGWSDEDRAELETFLAIALETMALAKPSLIRQASQNVEIKFHIKRLQNDTKPT